MDNDTILDIVKIVVTAVVGLVTAWIAYKQKQLETVQRDTHKLVNYQSMLLAQNRDFFARRLAAITQDPEDIKEAENATRLRQESEAKQASLKS